MLNCSDITDQPEYYYTVQTIFLSILLGMIIILNVYTLVVTFIGAGLCHCAFNRMFISSYAGNIMGACSLFLNDLLYFKEDAILDAGCRTSWPPDRYFFFYSGIVINMIVLLTSTSVRYCAIRALYHRPKNYTHKHIILFYVIPSWLVTFTVAAISVVIQKHSDTDPFLIALVLAGVPLIFVCAWNVQLKHILRIRRKESKHLANKVSKKRLMRAEFLVQVTVFLHIFYLLVALVVFIVLDSVIYNKAAVVTVFWVVRLTYTVMFMVEAKAFLYKTPRARQPITRLYRSVISSDRKSSVSEKSSSSQT